MRQRRMRGVSEEVQEAAKRLRREMTPSERRLWAVMREWPQEGVRWRRQHAVGRFVLDFYCPAARLCVERDGASHLGREAADAGRDAVLAAHGILTLRVSNDAVEHTLAHVVRTLLDTVFARLPPPPPR